MVYLVIKICKDGADWLKDINSWDRVIILLVPSLQQFEFTRSGFGDLTYHVEFSRQDRGRHRAVAIFLAEEHLKREYSCEGII
jgi:hypothetical protein